MGKKKIWFYLLLLPIILFLSTGSYHAVSAENADTVLDRHITEFLAAYFTAHPIFATWAGNHEYDTLLDDVSANGVSQDIALCRKYLKDLEALDPSSLSKEKLLDYLIFKEKLEAILFKREILKEHEWNPLYYGDLIDQAILLLLSREFDSFFERLLTVFERLNGLPRFLDQAKTSLKTPSKVHTETAIRRNAATLHLVKVNLRLAAEQSTYKVKKKLEKILPQAEKALEAYGKWLETDLLPRATQDFRLGSDLYDKELRYALSTDMTGEDLQAAAKAEMKSVQEEMFLLALPLYKEMHYITEVKADTPGEKRQIVLSVLDEISKKHPAKNEFLSFAKINIPRIKSYLAKKKLVAMDSEQQLLIRETPAYMLGRGVAYLDLPGPLEPDIVSYFNMDPLPAEWDAERIAAFLGEYNDFALQIIFIGETFPGRFTQYQYTQKTASRVRKIFPNQSIMDGWALYCEGMMIDHGYGYKDPRLKLVQLKERLKFTAAALIDYGVHVQGLQKEEGQKILMDAAMVDVFEAERFCHEACVFPVRIASPFIGVTAIDKFHDRYKKSKGESYQLRNFHADFLGYGPVAPAYLERLTAPEPAKPADAQKDTEAAESPGS